MTEEIKIGKKTSISLEVMILCLSAMLVIGGIWINLNTSLHDNEKDIFTLKTQMDGLNKTLVQINTTLGEMLLESKVQSGISRIRSTDRWTSSMEEASQKRWRDLIRKLHPDIDSEEFPKTKWIQTTYAAELL